MKNTLIAMSGGMKCGKDAAFEILHRYTPAVRLAFADPLKEEVAQVYGVTVDYINAHKSHFRRILQGHGTEFRRGLFGDDYWIKKARERLDAIRFSDFSGLIVFTDCRFRNEYDFIKENGGTVWRISRPNSVTSASAHESEALNFPYDILIENDSDLAALEEKVITAFGRVASEVAAV